MQSRNKKSLLVGPHNKDSVIVDPHNEDSLVVDPPDYMGVRMAQSTQNHTTTTWSSHLVTRGFGQAGLALTFRFFVYNTNHVEVEV